MGRRNSTLKGGYEGWREIYVSRSCEVLEKSHEIARSSKFSYAVVFLLVLKMALKLMFNISVTHNTIIQSSTNKIPLKLIFKLIFLFLIN